jgi:hypothetical protein
MTRPANNSEACCRPFPGEIYSSGVRANQSTSGFAETRNRRHRVVEISGWARPGAQKVIATAAARDTEPPTADAPSVKDPQSNQLSSMLAMAEVRALRGWQAGLVEAALLGQALQTCKPATYASTAFTGTS